MRPSFRLLPLACGTIAVLLVVKAGGLVLALAVPQASPVPARSGLVAPALASEPVPKPEKKPEPRAEAKPPAETATSRPLEPTGPSDAEKALLGDLRGRREKLDERAAGLDRREALIKAAERGLQNRLDQLTAVQAKLEGLEKTRSEREEANWRGLVKTYEAMRPREAAAIFNDLDGAVLVEVLDRMKEAKAAPILAAMQPERARALTTQLAQWRQRATGGPNG